MGEGRGRIRPCKIDVQTSPDPLVRRRGVTQEMRFLYERSLHHVWTRAYGGS
jgi:hypothetical protein